MSSLREFHYLDILQDTFMIRQLQPFHPNLKKRLVKSPKVCLRDSGLLHALLGIGSHDELLGHPTAGASWEGFVIEQILANVPSHWGSFFYRTAAGAEIDFLLVPAAGHFIAVEIKHSLDRGPVVVSGPPTRISGLERASSSIREPRDSPWERTSPRSPFRSSTGFGRFRGGDKHRRRAPMNLCVSCASVANPPFMWPNASYQIRHMTRRSEAKPR